MKTMLSMPRTISSAVSVTKRDPGLRVGDPVHRVPHGTRNPPAPRAGRARSGAALSFQRLDLEARRPRRGRRSPSARRVSGRRAPRGRRAAPSRARARRGGRTPCAVSPSAALRGVEADQPLERLAACGAPAPSPRGGRSGRRPSVTPPPTITKYCGTARPPSLRTLPWKPMPAMWCWPQPFGQPLILMSRSAAAATSSGRAAQVLAAAAAPRPRDCVTASGTPRRPGSS